MVERRVIAMIERLDFDEIDENYFLILAETQYYVVLQSRSTGHYWHLLERIANGHRTFQISHRHNPTDSYHLQTNKPSIRACCQYIMDHDAYHTEKVKKQKERRLRRLGIM